MTVLGSPSQLKDVVQVERKVKQKKLGGGNQKLGATSHRQALHLEGLRDVVE